MITHVLADWTTLHADNATSKFTQSEDQWLDLQGVRDLTAWIHVTQATLDATARVLLETSPTRDENLFRSLTSTSVVTGGVYVAVARAKYATLPGAVQLAQTLRWSVTKVTSADWSITFRIILALNPVVADFQMMRGGEVFSNPHLGGM